MRRSISVLAALGMLWTPSRLLPQAKTQDAAAIYKRQCASCHAANGSGQTTMGKAMKLRDLRSEEVQARSDAELFDVIAKGKGKMPGYANKLAQDDIHNLVKYMRGLGKKQGKK